MPVESYYKALGAQVLQHQRAAGGDAATYDQLGAMVAVLFADVLEIEEALAEDDERKIHVATARLVREVLLLLEQLSPDWCLRAPVHALGRFREPGALTFDLRRRVRNVLRYWSSGMERDALISLELVLKSALELTSCLGFEVGMHLQRELREG